jgi:hypothetical protein
LSINCTSSPALRLKVSLIGFGKLTPTEFPHFTNFDLNIATAELQAEFYLSLYDVNIMSIHINIRIDIVYT